MPAFSDENVRNVIPRWRPYQATVDLGELDFPTTEDSNPNDGASSKRVELLETDFLENRNISFAGDLISAALVSGNTALAVEAANFVLNDGAQSSNTLLTAFAEQVLGRPKTASFSINPVHDQNLERSHETRGEVARARRSLRTNFSDGVQWVDLARLYAINGLSKKAERSIRTALHLTPHNRFVVRSGARFFLHQHDTDAAYDLIKKAATEAKQDPWMVSAEIAIATAASRLPLFAGAGRGLISGGRFSDAEISELASALGTDEFRNGSMQKAKKLLRLSLQDPNENSLAQAKWMSKDSGNARLRVDVASFRAPRPYEASALEAYLLSDWPKALSYSKAWLIDEPFSSRAAQFAAYICSSILEDFETAEKVLRLGLIANPEDGALASNLVYTIARMGKLKEAKHLLSKVRLMNGPDWLSAAISANTGLLSFQLGDAETGRAEYSRALDSAHHLPDRRSIALALINWGDQESRFDPATSSVLLHEAEDVITTLSASLWVGDLRHMLASAKNRLNQERSKSVKLQIVSPDEGIGALQVVRRVAR